jgi:hypothetical protein
MCEGRLPRAAMGLLRLNATLSVTRGTSGGLARAVDTGSNDPALSPKTIAITLNDA